MSAIANISELTVGEAIRMGTYLQSKFQEITNDSRVPIGLKVHAYQHVVNRAHQLALQRFFLNEDVSPAIDYSAFFAREIVTVTVSQVDFITDNQRAVLVVRRQKLTLAIR
ncbi:MAG: hypothetical protein K1X28_05045 [Parachlamydiales bacterium]|nr:hypothetical protein [Parachlamydiales bacterium]